MSRTQYQLFAIAVALGYLYIALLLFKPYPLSWLLKPLPMLLFAWLAWSRLGGSPGRWLAIGTPYCDETPSMHVKLCS
ncbi:hypothetical protein [Pseudomonas sp.]|uniref:hypothetical protein n=1 Tax=Pseudomonas sp. TaxID=306 RepID=UPI003D0D5213